METIKITSIALLVLIVVYETSTFLAYGGFVNKDIQEHFCKLEKEDYRLNSLDIGILSLEKGGYISKVQVSLFSKYYISGLGAVPRWSKLHDKIDEYYLIALTSK